MTSPTRLSGDAFAVLRVFVRHTARRAGDTVDVARLRAEGEPDAERVGAAVAELSRAGLVAPASYWPRRPAAGPRSPGGTDHDAVVLTSAAEAFLARYHHSCHA